MVPLLTFVAVAWVDRTTVMAEAEREAADIAEICAQQALNVLQTHELVAGTVSEHVAGMSWDEIGSSAALHDYLARVDDEYPQMKGIWLVDRFGVIRSSSLMFPMRPVSVADRDYFIALRERDSGTVVGELVTNRVFRVTNFNVARRRADTERRFRRNCRGVCDTSPLLEVLARRLARAGQHHRAGTRGRHDSGAPAGDAPRSGAIAAHLAGAPRGPGRRRARVVPCRFPR